MVIGYIRVSTKEQAEGKNSLVKQKADIEKYFKENKISEYEILADEGYSAGSENRPSYKVILNMIELGQLTMLVFHKIDRINRTLIDYNKLMDKCIPKGIKLISVIDNINLDSATGRGISNVQMSFAQMEREQISERTKAGYVGAFIQGKYPISTLPLGISRNKQGKLKTNKDIEVVKQIFTLSYELGKGSSDIAYIVNKKYDYLGDFDKDRIDRILNNTVYRGFKEYRGETYQVIKPIVDYPIKAKIQAKKNIKVVPNYTYIFRDLIYYKGEKLYGSTTIKNKGKYKEKQYKYYLNKSRTIKINEDKLVNAIKDKLTLKNDELIKLKDERLQNLNELFVIGQISRHEYFKHKEKLVENCYNLDIEQIIRIEVQNKDYKLIVKTKQGNSFTVRI